MYDPYLLHSPKVGGWLTRRTLLETGNDEDALSAKYLADLEQIIFTEDPSTISAFILEPISGSSVAGAFAPRGYLEGVAELCRKHGILLIADEVFAGYGRTGKPRAMDHYGVKPDIFTLGKGMGSGYAPLSACLLSADVAATIRNNSGRHTQGYTFSGLPLACAIGVAVAEYIEAEDLFTRSAETGTTLREGLAARLSGLGDRVEVRGSGMLVGIEFFADGSTCQPHDPALGIGAKMAAKCMADGVVVLTGAPGGALFAGGDQLHFAPPFVATAEDIAQIIDVVGASVDSTFAELD